MGITVTDIYTAGVDQLQKLAEQTTPEINQYLGLDLEVPQLRLKAPPINRKNRAWYIWADKQIAHLETEINTLIDELGAMALSDPKTGQLIDQIILWRPHTLVFTDEYVKKLNEDFTKCKQVFEQIIKALEPYKDAWKGVK